MKANIKWLDIIFLKTEIELFIGSYQ